jgi:hypothetical protein
VSADTASALSVELRELSIFTLGACGRMHSIAVLVENGVGMMGYGEYVPYQKAS